MIFIAAALAKEVMALSPEVIEQIKKLFVQ